jgi:hypothetical protein
MKLNSSEYIFLQLLLLLSPTSSSFYTAPIYRSGISQGKVEEELVQN